MVVYRFIEQLRAPDHLNAGFLTMKSIVGSLVLSSYFYLAIQETAMSMPQTIRVRVPYIMQ